MIQLFLLNSCLRLEAILQTLEEYQQDTLVEEGRGEPALDLKSKEVEIYAIIIQYLENHEFVTNAIV